MQDFVTGELTIGDTNRDGTLQIMDTAWDPSGALRVTVRDASCSGQDRTAAMRRLARRAMPYPEMIRSSRVVMSTKDDPSFYFDGCPYVTFAVSR